MINTSDTLSAPLHILQATMADLSAIGGIQSHCRSLITSLQRHGEQVAVLDGKVLSAVPSRSAQFLRKLLAWLRAGGRAHVAADRHHLRMLQINIRRMAAALTAAPTADLLHAHDALSLIAAESRPEPKVLTIHGLLGAEQRMWHGKEYADLFAFIREVETRAYAQAQVIIAVSASRREYLTKEFHVPPAKIAVIYNGVNTTLFTPRNRPDSTFPRYLLVPKRLSPNAGVATVIQAMPALADTGLALWIAGDGIERAPLEALTEAMRLQDRVRFLGPATQQEIAALMQSAAAVVVPSIPINGVVEGCPMAVLEAMSSGVPVFATNTGGMPEIIDDMQTGVIFPAGDAVTLASLVRHYLLDHPDEGVQIGSRARHKVIAAYSQEVCLQHILTVYRRALHDTETS